VSKITFKMWSIEDFNFEREPQSEFVYEAAEHIETGLEEPIEILTTEQGHKLVELANQFLWTDRLSHKLLLGWIVVAPMCGCLEWRPHVWLTGGTGCGKGTVLNYFVKPLTPFRFPTDFSGNSTEAGIRQSVGIDALPIIYDEAESEDDAGRVRIRKILSLIRASSSATEKMVQGSTTGKAILFELKCSFLLSSINTLIDRAADRRRIAVLELRKSDDPLQWDALQKQLEYVTPALGSSLFARTFHLWKKVVKPNIAVFKDQVGKYLGDTTAGDQYGPLLAGAYLLENDEPVEAADAWEIVKGEDWSNFGKPNPKERDERRVLDTILEVLVPVQVGSQVGSHSEKVAIGELVHVVYGDSDLTGIDRPEARKSLARHGIKVESDSVCVAHHAAELQKLLPKGPSQNWPQHLRRLPGAETPEQSVWFAGGTQRCTKLPWSLFA
jgi:putative DNA primase/helicase